jgi:6-phosphogluconolactonase
VSAATFVYVSNAEDGDIGAYRLLDSGELQPRGRAKAAGMVMPMAVTPDRRFLHAACRSKPFTVHTSQSNPLLAS